MAKNVEEKKEKNSGLIPKIKRPFVGREELINIFFDKVDYKFGPKATEQQHSEPSVLVYHGLPGIGKSALRGKLAERLGQRYAAAIHATVDFQDQDRHRIENALFHIRTELKTIDKKIKFPAFDLAYSIWWKKANPNLPLNKDTFKLWGEAGLVSDVIAAAGEIPIVGFIPKVGQVIANGGIKLKDWWKKRGSTDLQALLPMQAHEVLEHLPMFLAVDIKNYHQEGRPPLVLFFDTYESLWAKERDEITRSSSDRWVTDLAENLPEALFVITGREKLHWHGDDYEFFENRIEHHEIIELPENKAVDYLVRCGIEDEAVREVILEGSGCVPVYLAVSVDTFYRIRDKQKREPVPDDFARSYKKIIERFLRNLDKAETGTIHILSAARKWDKKLFKKLVKKFDTGFAMNEFVSFHTFSFIKHNESANSFAMHDLIREQLQTHIKNKNNDSCNNVHQFLFEHYNKQLESAEVKNITETHKTALTEAFYHATCYKDLDQLFEWFFEAQDVFNKAAQWQIIVPLYETVIEILSETIGEDDEKVAHCLNNLAAIYREQGEYVEAETIIKKAIIINERTPENNPHILAINYNVLALLYDAQGKHDKAEQLYKKAIEIDKKTLGEDHPNLAIRYNNLASLYDNQGKCDKAKPLYKKAIEIDEKALGPDHPGLATDYNNLAGLYYKQGKYDEAEELYKKVIKIFEKSLGKDHPNMATPYNNLAELYREHGKYEKAEPLYLKALEIWEKAFPAGHPNIKAVLENIAVLYHNWGKEDKAREYALRRQALNDAAPDENPEDAE